MPTSNILAGLRVIELSAFVAAPLGGMTLAQMGAEVIRIDPPQGGLDYRRWPVTENNDSLFWHGLNKSKKSVAIDISSPEGRELVTELITGPGNPSHILLTNFPARGFLDYTRLSEICPQLIQLTITGDRFGNSAVDYTVNPGLGFPTITGAEDTDHVTNHVLPAWDLITGQMAVIGILAAERQRQTTGRGQHVMLSLEDAALAMTSHLGFLAEAQRGVERQRYGNYLFGAFGRDFTTADQKRIMVVGLTRKQWHALCQATMLTEPLAALAESRSLNFNNEGDRFIARHEIAALVQAWCSRHTLAEVETVFNQHGVCWSQYQTLSQRLHDSGPGGIPGNPLFDMISSPSIGEHLAAGLPLTFSGATPKPAEAAPALGSHTTEVLTSMLGLSSARVSALLERNIIMGPHAPD